MSRSIALEQPSQVVTPIKPKVLDIYLNGYQDQLKQKLIHGFTYGFKINSISNFTHIDSDRNAKTTALNPDIVTQKIGQEVECGRISGPFKTSPYKHFIVSPLGLREKKAPGQYRVIHDLSYPYDSSSVNAGIPRDVATVKYSSIVDAIRYINIHGRGCYMAKSDIKSAFRIIPIHPSDRHLLGLKWNGFYFFDNCLPMGCSSSCNIFESFSTSLEWIIKKFCPDVGIVHVLDDFLFIARTKEQCLKALNKFLLICKDIGVPIAPEKTMGPIQILPFLGIDLNTLDMTANLPQDKVTKFINIIEESLSSNSITVKKLQSLSGMLNFACGIIPQARAFTRRLYDLGIGISKPYYRVKMTQDVKKDLQIWKSYLLNYNYKNMLLDFKWISDQDLRLFTDASTTIGFGGYFGHKWFYGLWSDECKLLNIALLELYPICLALYMWSEELSNHCLTIHTDNMAVVHIINNSTSKDSMIMKLVRKLVSRCMTYNIFIRAMHIIGKNNVTSDFLSRNKVQEALLHNKGLDILPQMIPNNWILDKWLIE